MISFTGYLKLQENHSMVSSEGREEAEKGNILSLTFATIFLTSRMEKRAVASILVLKRCPM